MVKTSCSSNIVSAAPELLLKISGSVSAKLCTILRCILLTISAIQWCGSAHWLYADPDPHNLMNADPVRIQVNKIIKWISTNLLKVKIFFLYFKCVPKPERLATFFRFRLEKYNFRRKKELSYLNSFPFIIYLWIRIWIWSLECNIVIYFCKMDVRSR